MSRNVRNYARQTAWAVGLAPLLFTPTRAQSPVDQASPRTPDLQFLAPAVVPIEPLAAPNSGGGEAAILHPTPETLPAGSPAARLGEATPPVAQLHLGFDEVLESVRRSYPLLAAVLQERGIAAGE